MTAARDEVCEWFPWDLGLGGEVTRVGRGVVGSGVPPPTRSLGKDEREWAFAHRLCLVYLDDRSVYVHDCPPACVTLS